LFPCVELSGAVVLGAVVLGELSGVVVVELSGTVVVDEESCAEARETPPKPSTPASDSAAMTWISLIFIYITSFLRGPPSRSPEVERSLGAGLERTKNFLRF